MSADELRIVYRPFQELVPYVNNARVHDAGQLDAIKASLIEFGWTNPCLTAEDDLIAGHGRLLAAEALWGEGKKIRFASNERIPTVDLSHLTADQRRAYILADNRLAEKAGWDVKLLRLEVDGLAGLNFNLSAIGFAPADIRDVLGRSANAADPEDAPPVPDKPVSRPGDLWLMGDHRLLCGSCTDATSVKRLLGKDNPHLMVTDPPYGVEYDASWRNRVVRQNGSRVGARAIGKVTNDDQSDWSEAWKLFRGDVAYVWHAASKALEHATSLQGAGFVIRAQIIWGKNQMAIGRGDYHFQHEPCWYVVRKAKTGHWAGDRKQTTLWSIDKPHKSETGHSTQKPIECMRRPIVNNSRGGDAIYEPFCGSGTTIIAAQMEGRRCLALELEPAYIDVAVLRWEKFTGKEATLDGTGQSFSQTAGLRLKGAPKSKRK